jgi:hypothetical protein
VRMCLYCHTDDPEPGIGDHGERQSNSGAHPTRPPRPPRNQRGRPSSSRRLRRTWSQRRATVLPATTRTTAIAALEPCRPPVRWTREGKPIASGRS